MFSKKDYENYIIETAKAIINDNSWYSNEDILRFKQAIAQYNYYFGAEELSKMGIYVDGKGFNQVNIYIFLFNLLL